MIHIVVLLSLARCFLGAKFTAVFLLNEVRLKQDVVPEVSTRGLSKLQKVLMLEIKIKILI